MGAVRYYGEKEAASFSADGIFNIHPKGIIPLGGCSGTATSTKEKPFMITLSHHEYASDVYLAADDDASRKDWLSWIYECSVM